MRRTAWIWRVVLGIALSGGDLQAREKPCLTPDEAATHLNQDVCIRAHVYDIAELADGTRFLDVCRPEMTDEQCHFTIVSLRQDSRDVGALEPLRGTSIEIRGVLHSFGGRAGILLSHSRQLHGGPEKFRPNPALMKGFSAADEKAAFDDPAFKSGGHHHKLSSKSSMQ